MNTSKLEQAYEELKDWCRAQAYSGHDPFDALNSRIFQATPFKNSRLARLAWTQLHKRSPLNLRRLALVPEGRNAKGVALFALAALADYRRLQSPAAETSARHFLDDLFDLRLPRFAGAAWGYNFDWQSRNFFALKGTPTIVPTAFAAHAFLEAFEAFGERKYLDTARSTCDFILTDLRRPLETTDELCFSYSPFDNTQIFNASLLAAETIARTGRHTGEPELCEIAIRALRFVARRQQDDGSWTYGVDQQQDWIDSFHTAYVLLSFQKIGEACEGLDDEFGERFRRGYEFWKKSFFLADGWPKYYHDTLYPADTHVAASAIVTLVELKQFDREALPLAEKIAEWTLQNLKDRRGYFHYQRKRHFTITIPFMRWTQSWMAYALARLLEVKTS